MTTTQTRKLHADETWRDLLERPDAFHRENETDDREFYQTERMVQHLDGRALQTIETLITDAIVEDRPQILDLMASFDSHLNSSLHPSEVVGLGMNEAELAANDALSSRLVHDLNKQPELPFDDNTFDVVLNTVSVQYLTDPVAVFGEVNRVLKPGGLHLVIFSNRMFAPKAVRVWSLLSDDERGELVKYYFREAGGYSRAGEFVSMGLPRPADDKYADLGYPSDPIFAVMAEKTDQPGRRMQRAVPQPPQQKYETRHLSEAQKQHVAETLECPYCGDKLKFWAITENPMTTYDRDFYICINDACDYLVRGWEVMHRQGNTGHSYRLTFDPKTGHLFPTPIPSLGVIKSELIN